MAEEFQFISLDKIKVQKHNVRIHDIDQGIEDLAENIRVNGLLQPIAAYPDSKNSTFVILTGQRRLNAYHYLDEKYPNQGFDKIQCKIIEEPARDDKKKALSLAENITQLPMTNSDLIKAVTDLYDTYGDYDMVQQEFGITKRMVDTYVRLHRLPDELKEAIKTGAIHPKPKTAESAALRAVDALQYVKGGDISITQVIDLAKEMAKPDNSITALAEEAKKGGTTPEMVARAKKKPKSKLSIELSIEAAKKLQQVAESSGDTENTRATQYVIDGVDRDYHQMGD